MRQPAGLAQAPPAPSSRPVVVTLAEALRLMGVTPDAVVRVTGVDHPSRALDSSMGTPGGALGPVGVSPWLTVVDAAHYAKMKPDTIYSAIERGELRHVRVGGRRAIRLRGAWVDEWLERHAVGGVEPVTRSVTGEV